MPQWGEPFYMNVPYIDKRGFNIDSMVFYQVTDFSMQNRFRRGDLVFVDTSDNQPHDGEMYLIQKRGGAILRWIFIGVDDSLQLTPDSTSGRYQSELILPNFVPRLQIVGRVVYVSSIPTA